MICTRDAQVAMRSIPMMLIFAKIVEKLDFTTNCNTTRIAKTVLCWPVSLYLISRTVSIVPGLLLHVSFQCLKFNLKVLHL